MLASAACAPSNTWKIAATRRKDSASATISTFSARAEARNGAISSRGAASIVNAESAT